MIVNVFWWATCVAIIVLMVTPAFYNYGVFGDQGFNIAYAFLLAVILCFRLIKRV